MSTARRLAAAICVIPFVVLHLAAAVYWFRLSDGSERWYLSSLISILISILIAVGLCVAGFLSSRRTLNSVLFLSLPIGLVSLFPLLLFGV